MSKVKREFSFGWATVKPPGEAVTYDTDLRFFRRDIETGREIDNDEIHGVKDAQKPSDCRTTAEVERENV